MRAYLTSEEKVERAEMIERVEAYAKRERLEIVFSAGHRFYDVIFYDSLKGSYYNKSTDLSLSDQELAKYGLGV